MEVDHENEDESEYRLKVGTRVKYLKIVPGTFDSDTLSFPLGSLTAISFDGNWTVARVHREPGSGELKTSFSYQKLAAVDNIWHRVQVNVLDLERTKQLTGATFEAICKTEIPGTLSPTTTVIAKIARFEWEIPRIQRETRAYQILHRENAAFAPRFLGQLYEEDRVIGFMLEKLVGRTASIGDLEGCQAVLRKFHILGLLHGDVNRYNFLITEEEIKLIDFERFSENVSAEAQAEELSSLEAELEDTSGRGAGFIRS